MSLYKATDTQLAGIADAIRTKASSSDLYEFPTGFVSGINSIPNTIATSYSQTGSSSPSSTVFSANSSTYFMSLSGNIGPIRSWSFSKSFTGRDNLIVYTKYENNETAVYICNPTNSSITMPSNCSVRVQFLTYYVSA